MRVAQLAGPIFPEALETCIHINNYMKKAITYKIQTCEPRREKPYHQCYRTVNNKPASQKLEMCDVETKGIELSRLKKTQGTISPCSNADVPCIRLLIIGKAVFTRRRSIDRMEGVQISLNSMKINDNAMAMEVILLRYTVTLHPL